MLAPARSRARTRRRGWSPPPSRPRRPSPDQTAGPGLAGRSSARAAPWIRSRRRTSPRAMVGEPNESTIAIVRPAPVSACERVQRLQVVRGLQLRLRVTRDAEAHLALRRRRRLARVQRHVGDQRRGTTIGWAPAVLAATRIPIVATATTATPVRRSSICALQALTAAARVRMVRAGAARGLGMSPLGGVLSLAVASGRVRLGRGAVGRRSAGGDPAGAGAAGTGAAGAPAAGACAGCGRAERAARTERAGRPEVERREARRGGAGFRPAADSGRVGRGVRSVPG